MPPKFKFARDDIVAAAFAIVRRSGWPALTTRALAASLGASARPIYSFFQSISELEEEVVKQAVDLLHRYMARERTGDPWHDHGIGYVLFAMQEKALFRAVNDEGHIALFKQYGDVIWNTLTRSLVDYPPFRGLTAEQVYRIQLNRWLFAHGLAFSASNPPPDTWTRENVAAAVQEGSQAIYDGLRQLFLAEAASKKGGGDDDA